MTFLLAKMPKHSMAFSSISLGSVLHVKPIYKLDYLENGSCNSISGTFLSQLGKTERKSSEVV